MKNLRGDLQKPENNDDCRTLAPFVMTLFDGEADEIEARRARAHLLVCQTCARRWLDWNRSRDLIRTAPIPAPPPQLLWRILLACRLARTPQRARKNGSAPVNISAQILARTTRIAPPIPPQNPSGHAARRTLPLGIFAWAAPALMVWMLVLQRDIWLPAPVSPPTSPSTASRSRAVLARRAPVFAPRNRTTTRVAAPVRLAPLRIAPVRLAPLPVRPGVSVALEAPTVSVRTLSRRRGEVRPDSPARTIQARLVVDAARATPESFEPRSNATSATIAPESRPRDGLGSAPGQAALARSPEVRLTLVSAPLRVRTRRLAVLSELKPAPRLLAARWQPSESPNEAPLKTLSEPQVLRVSLPSAPAPAPTPQAARLLAENFESDDERIEEIRSVVEEFRATIGSDDAEAFADDENTG